MNRCTFFSSFYKNGEIPPTLNLDNPSDGCSGINLVPHESIREKVDVSLSNFFGLVGPMSLLSLKNLKAVLIHFIFILLIIFNCFFELFYKDYKIPQSEKIIITKGMKLSEVSSLLEKKNLIKNKLLFTFWVKLKSSGTKIKFGEYNFDNEISMNKIFFKLTSGDFFYRKITIIEGSLKIVLRNKIKKIYPLEQIEFENIPDYLIADTYLYNITDGASKLINNITKKSNETLRVFSKINY